MKNTFTLMCSLFLFAIQGFGSIEKFIPAGCSTAGTASSLTDSICYEDTTTLVLAGYVGSIQWQSFDGISWINESGTGSTTDNYAVVPGQTMQYRAVVTNGACPPDISNIVSVTVGTIPVPSGTGATRCGIGNVTVNGTGAGTLRWYNAPTGGIPLGSGSPFTTYVTGSTTLYLSDNVSGGSGGSSPVLITEIDVANADYLEIQNVSNQPVDVTGWIVAISNDYADINAVHPTLQVLSGIMQPGDLKVFTDDPAFPNSIYWGSNMLFNPGTYPTFTGWAMILDPSNNLMDFMGLNWPAADIQAMNPIVNGVNITIGSQWTGDGVDLSTTTATIGVERQGNIDNNDVSDFMNTIIDMGITNAGLILPFSGFGCSSPRIPIPVTVTPPATVTINPPTAALCLGSSVSLNASSSNINYAYTWSPATGLNSTTGATVIATPLTPTTYVVIGDDGTCASSDTIFVDVGPVSNAGTATNTVDTICLGNTVTLNLAGSVGNIQWQGNTGSGWVNENGPGFNSSVYVVSPTTNIQYMAVVTSGGCPADTSVVLSVAVLTVSDPVVNDTTVCAPDSVSFFAGGQGTMAWYNSPTGGPDLYLGNPYTAYITGTITLYVEARAGGTFHVGPADNLIGNVNQNGVAGNGLYFDVVRLCTLDKIYVFPSQTGMAKYSIYDPGGATVFTDSAFVTAFTGKTAIAIGFDLQPGTNYRLVMESGSVPLFYNYQNGLASYTIGTCPVTINNFSSPNYYFFYDWVVFEGCKSNRVPLNVTAIPAPAVPIINQNGSTLTSSSSINNQWYFNGNIIPGAVNQTLSISQTGLYTVVVTGSNGCTSSGSLNVTTIGLDEFASAGISVYPNPVSEKINVELTGANSHLLQIRLMQVNGSLVMDEKMEKNISMFIIDTRKLAGGSYLLEISTESGVFRKMMLKE